MVFKNPLLIIDENSIFARNKSYLNNKNIIKEHFPCSSHTVRKKYNY